MSALLIAAWFGVVTGLIEGLGFLMFQKLGWLNWYTALDGVSLEIIWISAMFNLFLFSLIGIALSILVFLIPRKISLWHLVFPFSLLMFFDWLSLTGTIHRYSVLILTFGSAVALARVVRKHEASLFSFWRRTLPIFVIVILVIFVGIQGGLWLRERISTARLPQASTNLPNLLFIIIDTLRADHLSTYGYFRPTTPNLDKIAMQGVLFERAYATSSWTPPSHASLLTGRYPYEHKVEWNRTLDDTFPTIAEALRANGYRTGAFSANTQWFCRRLGFARGFVRFEDYFHSLSDMASRTLYGRKFLRFWFKHFPFLPGFDDHPMRRRASDVNRSVLRWIDGHQEKPFFAMLNYMDTHAPYLPPPPHRHRFSPPKTSNTLFTYLWYNYRNLSPEQRLENVIGEYDDAVYYVDAHVGQLLEQLEERGFGNNTIVVITSDHGESLGEHGLFFHRNALYRELIQVPLIFWYPRSVPGGVRITQPVSNAAIPATLMDLVGKGGPPVFPGLSLSRLWENQTAIHGWPYALAEIARQPFKELKKNPVYSGNMKSLVTPRWQYIWHEKHGAELYNWKDDPLQTNNLAGTPMTGKIVERLSVQLQKIISTDNITGSESSMP